MIFESLGVVIDWAFPRFLLLRRLATRFGLSGCLEQKRRIRFVTEGILLRRMLADPELKSVGVNPHPGG